MKRKRLKPMTLPNGKPAAVFYPDGKRRLPSQGATVYLDAHWARYLAQGIVVPVIPADIAAAEAAIPTVT